MAVLSTFRAPSLGRHVHRELLRSVLLDLTPIISVTACLQRNYVERYSRYIRGSTKLKHHPIVDKGCIIVPSLLRRFPSSCNITYRFAGWSQDYSDITIPR